MRRADGATTSWQPLRVKTRWSQAWLIAEELANRETQLERHALPGQIGAGAHVTRMPMG